MTEYKSPFTLDELDLLFDARFNDDIDYLKKWSKRAVKRYEAEKNRLGKMIEELHLKAQKWDKLIEALSKGIIDTDDLVNLEYGPED